MSWGWVTIRKAAEESGYSEHAIRAKIADGTWQEGQVWRKAPDGRVLISMEGSNPSLSATTA